MASGAGTKLVKAVVRKIESREGSGFGVQGSEKKEGAQNNLRSRRTRSPYPVPQRRRQTLDLFS
jgi:hypothetical protein